MEKNSRLHLGAWLMIIAPFVFFIPQLIAESAWFRPHYNPLLNWISDNGVPFLTKVGTHTINSPLHVVMNIGLIGHALFFISAYWLLRPLWVKGHWANIMPYLYTFGVLLVGLFPGYEWAFQPLHPIIGATTFLIVGDILAIRSGRMHLHAGSRLLGYVQITLGIISLIAIPVMFIFYASGFEGLLERLSIYPILLFDLTQGISFMNETNKEKVASAKNGIRKRPLL